MLPAIDREQAHEALERLYDGLALGQTRLAACVPGVRELESVSGRACKLRACLLDAMESLSPAPPASFRSPATRSYEVMTLHFVEGLSMARIAEELSISERQAYRDLIRAEESLAELLSASAQEQREPFLPSPERANALGVELKALPRQSQSLDLVTLLADALRMVEPLAIKLRVSIAHKLPDAPLPVTGDQGLLSASLVQMFSAALRSSSGGQVRLGVQAVTETVLIEARFAAQPRLQGHDSFADLAKLASAQHVAFELARNPAGELVASLTLPRKRRRVVLVLEDNPSSVELYRRYLADSDEWELLAHADAGAALDTARIQRPAVIVLDVLMPEQDGWHVLQRLRAQPETAEIPILICSVFDDRELASALGASGYLKKPVSREQFLEALPQCVTRLHSWASRSPGRS